MSLVDFETSKNLFLPNPFWTDKELEYFTKLSSAATPSSSLILVATSGSADRPKLVAIKKEAFLSAAAAVNTFLESSSTDTWLQTLPQFHVGGLSIRARAHLSGAKILSLGAWDTDQFITALFTQSITCTSLVPTQLFDIVSKNITPPQSLRAVLIGGGALTKNIALPAINLGWPIYNSFGMTETSAMIAVKKLSTSTDFAILSTLEVLPHISVKISAENRLLVSGRSLFSSYIQCDADSTISSVDPKVDGWFETDDMVALSDNSIIPLGRITDTVKINGELLNLAYIRQTVAADLSPEIALSSTIIAVPHERTEQEIILIVDKTIRDVSSIQAIFDQHLPRFAKIKRSHCIESFPRSALGKILYSELKHLLQSL